MSNLGTRAVALLAMIRNLNDDYMAQVQLIEDALRTERIASRACAIAEPPTSAEGVNKNVLEPRGRREE